MKCKVKSSQGATGRTTRSRIPRGALRSPKMSTGNAATGGRGASTPKSTPVADIQKVLDRLDKIEESLEAKIVASIQSQEFTSKQLSDKITNVEIANSQAHAKCDKVEEDSKGIRVQLKVHGSRLQELEDRIELIERERRRNVLVIDGLAEKEGERTREVVRRIFEDLNVEFEASVCTGIFRRGKWGGDNAGNKRETAREGDNGPKYDSRPRPLVVIFPSVAEKAAIFRNLKNLQGKEEWSKVYFNDDLTETQANEQRDIRALAAFAKTKGYDAKVKAGNLMIDGRSYKYHELNKLPNDISLLKAKTLHILDDKGIVFQSQHSPLSNLYPCNLIYRGEVFLSSETAFQYTRAKVCGQEREAQLIKAERKAFKAKFIAKRVKSTREWEEMSEQVMKEILLEKFKRNKFCAQILASTGERALFEGTGDTKWGCGIPISKAGLISFKNPGRNILGHMLEEVKRVLAQKD